MKIKQSFIDRCQEITIKDVRAICVISGISRNDVLNVLSFDYTGVHIAEVLKAAANVLKINLSDIYEVEDLPNTHNEIF